MARNDGAKKPAVICDDRLSSARRNRLRLYATQRLPSWGRNRKTVVVGVREVLENLGGDMADAGRRQADRTRGAGGEVEHASLDEGTTVVDGDDDTAALVGDAQLGAERQRTVSRRHVVLIEALARGSLAAGLIAVGRSDAREAAAARRRDGRLGVLPAGAGVVAMVMMLPRLGRGF